MISMSFFKNCVIAPERNFCAQRLCIRSGLGTIALPSGYKEIMTEYYGVVQTNRRASSRGKTACTNVNLH